MGLNDLSEQDKEYLNNVWINLSDKVQNFIIFKKKNPEKYNFT